MDFDKIIIGSPKNSKQQGQTLLNPLLNPRELPKILIKFKRNHLHSYVYLVYFQSQKAFKIVKKKKLFCSFFINELLIQDKLQGLNIERILHQNVTSEEFNLTLAEPLGPSLKQLYQLCDFNFSVPTICQLGIRLLKVIMSIHSRKIVHTHLNPSKIAIGLDNFSKLYLIDFSRAFSYDIEIRKSLKQGGFLKTRKELHKVSVFSGRNVLSGLVPGFLDDLDSLLYILLYFFNGKNWINEEIANYQTLPYEGRIKSLETFKLISTNEVLCKKAPKLFFDFCKYIRELREGDYIDYAGLISNLKLISASAKPSESTGLNLNLKGKFDWLNHEKFEELIKTYIYKSSKNSPSSSPTNKSPSNRTGGLSNFAKGSNGGGSPTSNKSNFNNNSNGINGNVGYNKIELKLEKITEEEVTDKKTTVFDKINKLNKDYQFVFKNSFNKKEQVVEEKKNMKVKEPLDFEEGFSPNKNDYALFNLNKKEDLCFSNIVNND